MNNCRTCHYGHLVCPVTPCGRCKDDSGWKPFTNADKIRAMDDEELLDFIMGLGKVLSHKLNVAGVRKWLKEEAQ